MAENLQSTTVAETPAKWLSAAIAAVLLEKKVAKANGRFTMEIDFRDGNPTGVDIVERSRVRFLVPCVACQQSFDPSHNPKCPKCGVRRQELKGPAEAK